MDIIQISHFVWGAKEYIWHILGTWNRPTWLNNVVFKLGQIVLLIYRILLYKLKDILSHASMPRSLNMFPQGHILENDVWFNTIWFFGKKIGTCYLHIGQDNGQSNVEISFWHSKCWSKQHPKVDPLRMPRHMHHANPNNPLANSSRKGPNGLERRACLHYMH